VIDTPSPPAKQVLDRVPGATDSDDEERDDGSEAERLPAAERERVPASASHALLRQSAQSISSSPPNSVGLHRRSAHRQQQASIPAGRGYQIAHVPQPSHSRCSCVRFIRSHHDHHSR